MNALLRLCMMDTPLRFIEKHIQYFLLAGIIAVGIALRWVSADFAVILDYDPWWFYRHAQEIYSNNFAPPRWDILSYYPPGRPVDYPLGWSYTLATAYAITEPFHGLSLMKFSGLFVAVFGSLSAIPAYFAGRIVTNRWGALMTAFLVAISPIFIIGSLAGYPDSDSPVVFYTLIVILTTLHSIKKADILCLEDFKSFYRSLIRYLPHLIPALFAYWLFSLNWSFSWYIYFIILFFIPFLILFRVIEAKIFRQQKGHFSLINQKIRESRNIIISTVLIGLLGELITYFTNAWPYNTTMPHQTLMAGLSFIGAGAPQVSAFIILFTLLGAIAGLSVSKIKGLLLGAVIGFIIPISLFAQGIGGETLIEAKYVSELQPVSLFSFSGVISIITRIGMVPLILGGVGIIVLMIFKLIKKMELMTMEYFALFWIIASLLLLNYGVRFSLLLMVPIALSAGLVLGNLSELLRHNKNMKSFEKYVFVYPSVYGLIVLGLGLQVYGDFNLADQRQEAIELPEERIEALTWLKQNVDKDSLVVTWWDLGHIITGFTGLKAYWDGAHCSSDCIPYDMNVRTVVLARVFFTDNESEALDLLRKYTAISSEDCLKVWKRYGTVAPRQACNSASEVYMIVGIQNLGYIEQVSNLGSSGYLSYLGYLGPLDLSSGSLEITTHFYQFRKLQLTGEDENGNLNFGNGAITVEREHDRLIPLVNATAIGYLNKEPKNTKHIASQIVFYDDQGDEKRLDFSDLSDRAIGGIVWLSPDNEQVIFIDNKTSNALFSRLFFLNGEGLQHFQLVFKNPEIKIYKVLL